MMNNPFDQYDAAYIEALNNAYSCAEVAERKNVYGKLPDGKYQVFVDTACVQPGRNDPTVMRLDLEIIVLQGEYAGHHISKSYPIVPERLEYLKSDLVNIFGLDIDNDIRMLGEEETLLRMLDAIIDLSIKNTKKNGKEYYNIYLNRYVGQKEPDSPWENQ